MPLSRRLIYIFSADIAVFLPFESIFDTSFTKIYADVDNSQKIIYTIIAVLGGELAVPCTCNPQ